MDETEAVLTEAYEAAEAAHERGDRIAFRTHARQWVRALYGSCDAGDAAIAANIETEGSEYAALEAMVYG